MKTEKSINTLFSLLAVAEVPSSPVIQQVEPFSSTAVVKFEEPDSMGGVPIIKYRVEWRLPGQDWTGKEEDVEDGESVITQTKFLDYPSLCITSTCRSGSLYKKCHYGSLGLV